EPDTVGSLGSGFWTPAREQLPEGLENVLAAQAMFPVLSHIEMAGHKGENPIGTAVANDQLAGEDGAWNLLAQRLRAIPAYVQLFADVFDDVDTADDITFVHAANALAAFETVAFRTDNSPFDAYLRSGNADILGEQAADGMALFYGEAGCGQCHSGSLQTDNDFHAIAMPQIGPGKQHGQDTSYWRASGFPDRLEDQGRYRVSFDPEDKYAFRTPSLRNVELTGPWGHAGNYATLEGVIRHHLDPVTSLHNYQTDNANLVPVNNLVEKAGRGSELLFPAINPARLDDYMARDTWVHRRDELRASIADANDLDPTSLNEQEITQIVAFLQSLTDPASRDLSHLIPTAVPSGLPVSD
ncbi:MAG: cytochrome c peroxidase, partial [Planctomycetota bacterium]